MHAACNDIRPQLLCRDQSAVRIVTGRAVNVRSITGHNITSRPASVFLKKGKMRAVSLIDYQYHSCIVSQLRDLFDVAYYTIVIRRCNQDSRSIGVRVYRFFDRAERPLHRARLLFVQRLFTVPFSSAASIRRRQGRALDITIPQFFRGHKNRLRARKAEPVQDSAVRIRPYYHLPAFRDAREYRRYQRAAGPIDHQIGSFYIKKSGVSLLNAVYYPACFKQVVSPRYLRYVPVEEPVQKTVVSELTVQPAAFVPRHMKRYRGTFCMFF